MSQFRSLISALAITAVTFQSADPWVLPAKAGQECHHPSTQAQINACAAQRASDADQTLNRSYQILKASLPPAQMNLLVAAQLAWIRFRDAQCALEKSAEAGGSLAITSQLECVRRLSIARAQDLQSLRPLHPTPAPTSRIPSTLIEPNGIGPARLGMTVGELKATLASRSTVLARQSILVDVDALPIASDGVVQFLVLVPAGSPVDDSLVIRALLTTNPAFRTREGIGPGMLLSEAARLYGPATLTMNRSNESRETATFAHQPAKQIRLGIKAESTGLAGFYPKPLKEYNQTDRYQPTSTITFVMVGIL